KSLSYLGIKIGYDYNTLFNNNYVPLIKTLKKDLENWHDKPISWIGRIHSIKMNILPRLLFLFQALPIKPNWLKLLTIYS
ncbi:endonuclease, partial, partial [Pelobates cultripes]